MIGRVAGAVIGAAFNKQRHEDPVSGALIGAATMFVARRFLPARVAALGATIAAGDISKKFADRQLARAAAAQSNSEEVARSQRSAAARKSARDAAAAASRRRAQRKAADRTVEPTARTSKLPRTPEPATPTN